MSIGCEDRYLDRLGSFAATAVLIRTPVSPPDAVFQPSLLSLLLKRTPGTLRTTISDMQLALYLDDGSKEHNPGVMVRIVVHFIWKLSVGTIHIRTCFCVIIRDRSLDPHSTLN